MRLVLALLLAVTAFPNQTTVISPAEEVSHIGGSVKAPTVIKTVEPKMTDKGRLDMRGKNIQVYLWVEKDGVPSHVKVIHGASPVLDEAVVAAVKQYRFKPATRDGKPVKVDLYMDVNINWF